MPSNERSHYNINLQNQVTTNNNNNNNLTNNNQATNNVEKKIIEIKNDKNNKKIRENIDFDDLLPYIGEFNRYQKILFLLMIPFAFFVAWVYFTQIFITLIPEEHWCRVPALENLTLEQRISLAIPVIDEKIDGNKPSYAKCLMYDIDFTELLKKNNSTIIPIADPAWPTKKCQFGWEYNFTNVPYETVATENNWVCDNSALGTIAQSIFFIGAIFGGLLFGWIADRYGRIPALVGCNIVGCVAGISTAFTTNFWQFVICRFFVGFAFDNCFTMMYILVLEYVGPKWRTFVANMSIAIFFTFAACVLPWIAYFIGNWRYTVVATSLPLALAIFTPYFVPESARWLVSMGKIDKAIDILHKFERINGTKVPDNIMHDFKETCKDIIRDEKENTYSVISLFKSPRLRKITILLIFIWMAISLVFDGHVRNVDNLGLNVFITFTVAAATEFPADTFLTMVLDKWGRRWLACGSMVISGIFSIWACAVSDHIYSASLAIMGRFCVNISYNIGLQYAAELLPTVVRAQGVALIHTMGYVASIAAPFVVYLGGISTILPLLLLGIFGIIGGGLSLFLPETLDQDLPQTLQDGEDFGKDQGIWDMPCFIKKLDDEKEKPGIIRLYKTESIRGSFRGTLRGETMRSSMILRSSIRLRTNNARGGEGNTPVEVVVRL